MRFTTKAVILATAGATAAVPGGVLYGTAPAGAISRPANGHAAARPQQIRNYCLIDLVNNKGYSPATAVACCSFSGAL